MAETAPVRVDPEPKTRTKGRANGRSNVHADGPVVFTELPSPLPIRVNEDFLDRVVDRLLQEGDAATHLQNKMQIDALIPDNFPDLPDGVLALHRFHARNILANNWETVGGLTDDPALQALVRQKAKAVRHEGSTELKGVLLAEFPTAEPVFGQEPEQAPGREIPAAPVRINDIPTGMQNAFDLVMSHGWVDQLTPENFPFLACLEPKELLTLIHDATERRKGRYHHITGEDLGFSTPDRSESIDEQQMLGQDPDYVI